MTKPPIKDRQIKAYVEYLEGELNRYKTSGDAQLYVAINEQMIKISKNLRDITIDIESDKSDALFDRWLKLSEKSGQISDNLEKIRKKITPEEIQEIKADATVEKFIMNEVQ